MTYEIKTFLEDRRYMVNGKDNIINMVHLKTSNVVIHEIEKVIVGGNTYITKQRQITMNFMLNEIKTNDIELYNKIEAKFPQLFI